MPDLTDAQMRMMGFSRNARWEGTPEDQAAYAAKHGTRMHTAFADETDVQIASRVRMLMRTDLEHESLCTAGRDRICALVTEKAELLGELRRVTDHLEAWARDHSDEATAETWAALHCAREITNRETLSASAEGAETLGNLDCVGDSPSTGFEKELSSESADDEGFPADQDMPDDPCDHGEASYDILTGRAHCHRCDTVWYPDAAGARSLNPLA